MNRLNMENGSYFSEFEQMSRSFKIKLLDKLMEFLENVILNDEHKRSFTKLLDIDLGHNFPNDGGVISKYNISTPHEILFSVSTKGACTLAQGKVYWRPLKACEASTVFPWSDVSKIELYFKIIMPPHEIQMINLFMNRTGTYNYPISESGLKYNCQINGSISEGYIVFDLKNKPNEKIVQALENILSEWVTDYNQSSKNTINYIGEMVVKGKKVYAYLDGVESACAVKECFKSFSKCDFINSIFFG